MPLIHSKKPSAFSKNVSTEMHAGKPQKQALAIAYSVKRKAHKAEGGCVCNGKGCAKCMDDGGQVVDPDKAQSVSDSFKGALGFKEGGEVKDPEIGESESPGEDDELHDEVGKEIMEAFHSKDHKKLRQGLDALIMSHMNKKED